MRGWQGIDGAATVSRRGAGGAGPPALRQPRQHRGRCNPLRPLSHGRPHPRLHRHRGQRHGHRRHLVRRPLRSGQLSAPRRVVRQQPVHGGQLPLGGRRLDPVRAGLRERDLRTSSVPGGRARELQHHPLHQPRGRHRTPHHRGRDRRLSHDRRRQRAPHLEPDLLGRGPLRARRKHLDRHAPRPGRPGQRRLLRNGALLHLSAAPAVAEAASGGAGARKSEPARAWGWFGGRDKPHGLARLAGRNQPRPAQSERVPLTAPRRAARGGPAGPRP